METERKLVAIAYTKQRLEEGFSAVNCTYSDQEKRAGFASAMLPGLAALDLLLAPTGYCSPGLI